MRKLRIITTVSSILGALLLAGSASGQQGAGGTAAAKPAAQTPAVKTPGSSADKKTTGTKTGNGTGKKAPAVPPALKTQKDKTSYAIGLNIGKGMQRDGIDVDPAVLARGLKDGLSGAKARLTDEEIEQTLTALQLELHKKQEEKLQVLGDANKKQGEAFLAANKAKDGVVALPDGLQYKVLKEGTGPKPAATDSVVCNYRGTFLDGNEFDSSYKRGQPATFPVSGVIKGWTEALQLMPVGSKWQLFVPSDLAYGTRGAGPGSGIGPNAALIFEVELLSIQAKEAQGK